MDCPHCHAEDYDMIVIDPLSLEFQSVTYFKCRNCGTRFECVPAAHDYGHSQGTPLEPEPGPHVWN